MPIAFPIIPTFFCPFLSSLLTQFTCDSQFLLSILQCQGEWCHKLDSCPFPSGIHKWIIFYFHKNSSVLPDCLGLYESQMVLPPQTFQRPLMISIMPALWNVRPQPSLQQMYTAVIYQLLGGFLLGWSFNSLVLWREEFEIWILCLLLYWNGDGGHGFDCVLCIVLDSQTFGKGTTLKQGSGCPACAWKILSLTTFSFYPKVCKNLFFMQNHFLLHFMAVNPGWRAGGNGINSLGIFQIYNLSLQWFTSLAIPTAE